MYRLKKDPYVDIIDLFFVPNFNERSNKRTNVLTNDEDYRIQFSVPGLSKSDVKIRIKDSVISISYEKEKSETFFFTGSFLKEYTLPEDSDEKNITSKMENGILEITIPRVKKKSNERLISIN